MDCKNYALQISSDFEHLNVTKPQANNLFTEMFLLLFIIINLEA